MRIEPAITSVSIVLLGQFNPAIFTPAWFSRYDILPATEADSASSVFVHSEVTQFSVERADVYVDMQKFMVSSKRAPWIQLHDVVLKTFGEYLVHTPIHQMGINKYVHFEAGSIAARDAVGEALAPQAPWASLDAVTNGMTTPGSKGLLSLRRLVAQGLPDRPRGNVNARVEPSAELKSGTGIFVEVNDHFEVVDRSEVSGASSVMELLQGVFEHSLERSDAVIDSVMALVPQR
ncbi:hypothetical protein [Hydrocarboniphaga effusa]|jgi:hypothetical protein|uniref:hypothetical protein n=1 Tax=Hydrocarboniphaga effusa TaxID=243629 RepID=UPI003137E35D